MNKNNKSSVVLGICALLIGMQCQGATEQEAKLMQRMISQGINEEIVGTRRAQEEFEEKEQREQIEAQAQVKADEEVAREMENKKREQESAFQIEEMLKQEGDILAVRQADIVPRSELVVVPVSEIHKNIIKYFTFLQYFIEDNPEATEILLPSGVTRESFNRLEKYADMLTMYENHVPLRESIWERPYAGLLKRSRWDIGFNWDIGINLSQYLVAEDVKPKELIEDLVGADYLGGELIMNSIIDRVIVLIVAFCADGNNRSIIDAINHSLSSDLISQVLIENILEKIIKREDGIKIINQLLIDVKEWTGIIGQILTRHKKAAATILKEASKNGDAIRVTLLLEKIRFGSDDFALETYMNAFLEASDNNHHDIMKLLMSAMETAGGSMRNADCKTVSFLERYLYSLAYEGKVDRVKVIINTIRAGGGDVRKFVDLACNERGMDIFSLLIAKYFYPSTTDIQKDQYIEIIKILIGEGATVGGLPLSRAIGSKDKKLIDAFSEWEKKERYGY